jgi:hypothetical protein
MSVLETRLASLKNVGGLGPRQNQKRVDGVNAAKIASEDRGDGQDMACLRISNTRYAKDSGLEERLSAADREMLREMGIFV